ncbi:MAG: Gfo/Idh/MocA family oxidoreductase [Fimbriimonadaceae bacterium]|nr:Gfo/Idh/MocA family oxidoreductase [Fimbriimonadaceae bacterium]
MAVAAPIRVGIVGVGRAGWGMHRGELDAQGGFQIVAACDRIAERAERLAAERGARAYTDYRDLVADPAVDLVVTATRSDTHAAINIAALEAGKHVIAEKPFATSVAQADQQIAVAARSAGRLLVRQNRRWDPAWLHIKEILSAGLLGEIQQVRLYRHNYSRRADWQTLKAFSGGLLNNWGPHIIDHALLILQSPIVSLWSDLRNVAAAGDAEDSFKICLRGANGRLADLEVTGGMALGAPCWQLYGSQGALEVDAQERTLRLRYHDRSALPPVVADPSDPPMEGNFGSAISIPWVDQTIAVAPQDQRRFYDVVYEALTTDSEFPVRLEEARQVVWVTEMARRGSGF